MYRLDRQRAPLWGAMTVVVALAVGCVPETGGDPADMAVDMAVDMQLIDSAIIQPQCSDSRDNDGDGLIDLMDPACSDFSDNDESDDPPPPQCSNGEDDDGDGDVDLMDRGCASGLDDDESDEPPLPQCQNGIDDDMDNFIDFPADPGCGSEFDDDESNEVGPALPQCADGQDNDGDGRVDLADPGCSSVADPRETDPEEAPACFNGIDDDGDAIIDFPRDPGCSAAGDDDESDPANPPACANGLDDDGDGLIDFPEDPGCAGVGDNDEADPSNLPACSDGVDNDRDGTIDYPDDPGCEAAADGSEQGSCGRMVDAVEVTPGRIIRGSTQGESFREEGSCGGRGAPEVVFLVRVDRPVEGLRVTTNFPANALESTLYIRRACGDPETEIACAREPIDEVATNELFVEEPLPGTYYIFLDGAAGNGGQFELLIELVPRAACRNGIDDDEDGRADYPGDPGCDTPLDRDETDPDVLPECADDEDNDGDGLIDYPLDIGCRAASDDDEVDLCGEGVVFYDYPVGEPFILDDTSMGGTREFEGSCGGNTATEKVYYYRNPYNANLTFSTDHPETDGATVLYVRTACTEFGSELGCSPGPREVPPDREKGVVTIERAPPGDYFVFVDHPFGLGIPFKLSVEVERLPPGCQDLIDNDEDGFIDGDDVGCSSLDDEDERDPEEVPVCFNRVDDDEDGYVDYPEDPGCFGKGFPSEEDPDVPPACANGLDDDEDGDVDYPLDSGCSARSDDEEERDRVAPACSNARDDDGDRLTDFPFEPGCAAPGDLSEEDDDPPPECSNGVDDDRDGLVDFPYEPGCFAAGDPDESEPEVPAACSNGVDDDGDGVTDFPREPGCMFAGDDDEADPGFPPQCANGNDDDRNGRIDFPDDPGCRFAADTTERSDGAIPPRCSDGIDNDDDGAPDLLDIGCENARDNTEDDPEVAPLCANGLDDDGDGQADWPDDDGCAAQGDICEQAGWGFCDGECVPLLDNPVHCGRCGRACSEGVECIDGRCGELRERVRTCGNPGRNVGQFIRGELAEAEIILEPNTCQPADDVQAILVPRSGVNAFNGQAAAMRNYVNNGGVVITEYNISHTVYNALTQRNVAQGPRNGGCSDNIQPAVQFNAQDQFWVDNAHVPPPRTGCGYSVAAFPDIVRLGGWDQNSVSLAYIDIGAGRLWLVEADWQDSEASMTDASRDLMAYMIANGAVINRP